MGKKFSRMKTNDIKVIKLMKEGFSFETLRNLNESQVNILYKKIIKEISEPKEATTQTVKKTTYSKSEVDKIKQDQGGLNVNGTVSPNDDGSVTVTTSEEISEDSNLDAAVDKDSGYDPYAGNSVGNDAGPSSNDGDNNADDGMSIESEIKEKAVSKKQQKFMGLVKSYKEGDVKPSEVSKSVKDAAKSMTKKEVDDFASTKHKGLPTKVEKTKKESYLRNVKMIEESLIKLVQKHITPVMTKKDLINIVEQGPGTKEAPTKTPTKTPSKPERKNPYKPKHAPAPKAKKDDETFSMELPSFLKFDNLNIQFSDEKES